MEENKLATAPTKLKFSLATFPVGLYGELCRAVCIRAGNAFTVATGIRVESSRFGGLPRPSS